MVRNAALFIPHPLFQTDSLTFPSINDKRRCCHSWHLRSPNGKEKMSGDSVNVTSLQMHDLGEMESANDCHSPYGFPNRSDDITATRSLSSTVEEDANQVSASDWKSLWYLMPRWTLLLFPSLGSVSYSWFWQPLLKKLILIKIRGIDKPGKLK